MPAARFSRTVRGLIHSQEFRHGSDGVWLALSRLSPKQKAKLAAASNGKATKEDVKATEARRVVWRRIEGSGFSFDARQLRNLIAQVQTELALFSTTYPDGADALEDVRLTAALSVADCGQHKQGFVETADLDAAGQAKILLGS